MTNNTQQHTATNNNNTTTETTTTRQTTHNNKQKQQQQTNTKQQQQRCIAHENTRQTRQGHKTPLCKPSNANELLNTYDGKTLYYIHEKCTLLVHPQQREPKDTKAHTYGNLFSSLSSLSCFRCLFPLPTVPPCPALAHWN